MDSVRIINNKRGLWALAFCFPSVFAPAQHTSSQGNGPALEEIVVTAQKREQSVEQVPISINVVPGELLFEQGLFRMEEMSAFVPNLMVQEGIGSSVISVRGLATQGFLNPAFEMSTGMFQDGIHMAETRQSIAHLLDVDRVEVLRGPQPVYFGQGAIAGAISVTSVKPGDKAEGYARASYGTDEEASIDFAYGGPLTDTLGARIALRHYRTDGYFEFTQPSGDGPEHSDNAGRLTLDWAPTDSFDASVWVESYRNDIDGVPGSEQINCDRAGDAFCALVAADPDFERVEWNQNYRGSQGGEGISYEHQGLGTGFGPFGGLAGVTLGMMGIVAPDDPLAGELFCPPWGSIIDVSAYGIMDDMSRDTEGDTVALSWNLDLGFATLSSLSAYQNFFNEIGWELDGTAAAGFASHQEDEQDQYSQELRLTSNGAGDVQWMLGLYYQDADFETFSEWTTAYAGGDIVAPLSPLAPFRHVQTDIDDTWAAAFASVSWQFTETLSLDLGVRYTDVEKEAKNTGYSRFINPDGDDSTADYGAVIPGSEQVIERDFDDTSTDPSVALNWQVSDDIRAYARYAEGFKSGGFGVGITIPVDDPDTPFNEQDSWIYDSEEATLYEVGFKSRLMDGRLLMNVALFDTDFDNLQVSAFDNDALLFRINNAASAHSRGLEVEGDFAATDRLRLRYGLALLDAEYDSFEDAQCSKFESSGGDTCDRGGEDLEYASDWNLVLGADYRLPLDNGLQLDLQAYTSFSDGYALGYGAPNMQQDDYEIVNLRIVLSDPLAGWEVAAYGRNITDERLANTVSDGAANGPTEQSFSSSRGDSYGVQVAYKF